MGKIVPFIKRAEEAGLRNEVPTEPPDIGFLARGEDVCLILSETLPDERELGFALVVLVFGEPPTPGERPPQLVLRYDSVYDFWELSIEPDDAELSPALLAFASNFALTDAETVVVIAESDELESIFNCFIERVRPVSLACAS